MPDAESILTDIGADLGRPDLSLGAKVALAAIRVVSGAEQQITCTMADIAASIQCPIASTRRYMRELKDRALIIPASRGRYSITWVVVPEELISECPPVETLTLAECSRMDTHTVNRIEDDGEILPF
jgi:hypothetical protein